MTDSTTNGKIPRVVLAAIATSLCIFGTLIIILPLSTNSLHEPQTQANVPFYFSVPSVDPVAMGITDSVHYQLDTEEGIDEFSKLLPSRGHTVYIDRPDDKKQYVPNPQPYTVTLFHQLKCLDIIREQYTRASSLEISTITRHCFNYLRQTIICRPNLRLESAKNVLGTASRVYDAVCQDWTAVYNETERNHDAYLAWRNETSTK